MGRATPVLIVLFAFYLGADLALNVHATTRIFGNGDAAAAVIVGGLIGGLIAAVVLLAARRP